MYFNVISLTENLPQRAKEGQAEYFGKRGMSLLGFMLVRRVAKLNKDNEEVVGLEYSYYDVVVDGYSSQDHIQVTAIIESVVERIHADHPEITSIMLGSDNASCLSSHDFIVYMHFLNDRLNGIKINNWVYTEACTGKNRLDTHFSYVNMKLKTYMRDNVDNDVMNKRQIFEALCYQGGIAGTTVMLFDGANLKGPVLARQFKATNTGVRETHEVLWANDTPYVYTISEVTKPEIITGRRLNNSIYKPNQLHTGILQSFVSPKKPLFKADEKAVRAVDTIDESTSLDTDYVKKIKAGLSIADVDFGDEMNDEVGCGCHVAEDDSNQTCFASGWACYPKNVKSMYMKLATMQRLNALFVRGNTDKARRVTADRARLIILEDTALNDWYEQALVTDTRVKAFFSAKASGQLNLINEARKRQLATDNVNRNDNNTVGEAFESLVEQTIEEEVQEIEADRLDMVENIELEEGGEDDDAELLRDAEMEAADI